MSHARIARVPTLQLDRVGGNHGPTTEPRRLVTDRDCLFCKIVAGEIPADIVRQDDELVAFRDINPQAPTHVLVIPTEHVESLDAAADEHAKLLGKMLLLARDLAREEGVAESGYRTVLNVGAHGGQSVFHVHLHLLGGRPLRWPPG